MFNMCKAVKATMVLENFDTKEQTRDFLDVSSVDKEILSVDKVIYTFDDDSFVCCDGDSIQARPAGHSKAEFLH